MKARSAQTSHDFTAMDSGVAHIFFSDILLKLLLSITVIFPSRGKSLYLQPMYYMYCTLAMIMISERNRTCISID